jgi:hypothetical protein
MKTIIGVIASFVVCLTVQAARFDIPDVGKIVRVSDPQI